MLNTTQLRELTAWASAQGDACLVFAGLDCTAVQVINEAAPGVRVVVFDPTPGVVDRHRKQLDTLKVVLCDSPVPLRMELAGLRELGLTAIDTEDLGEPALKDFAQVIKEEQDAKGVSNATYVANARAWAQAVLSPMPLLSGSVPAGQVGGALPNTPGILVGAGPSLDTNVAALADLDDSSLIVAGVSSYGPLKRAGVRPHVIVVADKDNSAAQFEGDPWVEQMTLCYGPHTKAEFHRLPWHHRVLMSCDYGPPAKWQAGVFGNDIHSTGPSVSTFGVTLLHHLNCGPIMLVGQDCAHTNDKLHAAGSVAPNPGHPDAGTVEAWGGLGSVATTLPLDLCRRWLEDAACAVAGRISLINCTEGGARIKGWDECHLADAVQILNMKGAPPVSQQLNAALDAAEPLDMAAVPKALCAEVGAADAMLLAAKRAAEAARAYQQAEDHLKLRIEESPLVGAAATTAIANITTQDFAERAEAIAEAITRETLSGVGQTLVATAQTMEGQQHV